MDLFDSNLAFPLSPMQQGMLFHSRFAPRSGVYIQQIVGVLDHRLDAGGFFECWRRVIARHPALRTSFVWEGLLEPMQRVHTSVGESFYQEDWVQFPESVQEKKIKDYISADRAKGFDYVFLSIIPSTATILEKNNPGYNRLIPSLYSHPALKIPVIDVYGLFRDTPIDIFAKGDTHWNAAGFYLWLDKFNAVLEGLPHRQKN